MEEELGPPMFSAVVAQKTVIENQKREECMVELQVRFRRRNVLYKKHRNMRIIVQHGTSERSVQRYLSAKKLRPGDELYVDGYGEEWSKPKYCNIFQRWRNMVFA